MRALRGYVLLVLTAALLAVGCSDDVRIGAVVSESGGVAPYAADVRRGIDLALEQVNAAGGVDGNVVELIFKDDMSNPEAGKQAVEDLIQDEGVRVILGPISSTVTLAVAPICEKERTVCLSPTASAPAVSDAGEYIFRNYPSDILEGTAMADLAKDLELERVAIFALDNDYGEGLTDVFRRGFESRFRDVVRVFPIDAGTPEGAEEVSERRPGISGEGDVPEAEPAGSFAALAEQVKELGPDGIYIVGYFEDMLALLRALEAAEVDAVLLGSSSVTAELLKQAGTAAEMLVYPQPTAYDPDAEDPAVTEFVRRYEEKYGEKPSLYAAQGYDALMLLIEAIRQGASAHPDDVRSSLLGIESWQGAAGHYGFDAKGDVVRYPHLFVAVDGESMPYEQFVREGGKLPVPDPS